MALGALAYGLFWMSVYGVPTGLGTYGGVPDDAAFNPLQALLGLLFDRAYGILPIAPVFAALFLFAWPATKGGDASRARRIEVTIVLAVCVPVLFWRMWWGGQSPPARLLAPAVPFLALWLARQWDGLARPAVRKAIVAALAWSWGLFLFAALQPGRLLFINKRVRPTRLWDALWPGGPLDSLLPDMARPEVSDWPIALGWTVVIVILAIAARRSSRNIAPA